MKLPRKLKKKMFGTRSSRRKKNPISSWSAYSAKQFDAWKKSFCKRIVNSPSGRLIVPQIDPKK